MAFIDPIDPVEERRRQLLARLGIRGGRGGKGEFAGRGLSRGQGRGGPPMGLMSMLGAAGGGRRGGLGMGGLGGAWQGGNPATSFLPQLPSGAQGPGENMGIPTPPINQSMFGGGLEMPYINPEIFQPQRMTPLIPPWMLRGMQGGGGGLIRE